MKRITCVFVPSGNRNSAAETMTSLESRLNPQMFLGVHRSAIVNLQYVREVKNEVMVMLL